MSNFTCPHCGMDLCDTDLGYVTGCVHYPPDRAAMRAYPEDVRFKKDRAVLHGELAVTAAGMAPEEWEEE